METCSFDFLSKEFNDIYIDCLNCEKQLLDGNFKDSILNAGNASNNILSYVCDKEDLSDLKQKRQKRILKTLKKGGIISSDLSDDFNHIRLTTNMAKDSFVKDIEIRANQIHKKLFEVASWFYNKYGDSSYEISDYSDSIYNKDSESENNNFEDTSEIDQPIDIVNDLSENSSHNIGDTINDSNEEFITMEDIGSNYEVSTTKDNEGSINLDDVGQIKKTEDILDEKPTELNMGNENSIDNINFEFNLDNYPFQKYEGSYLLNELTKLKNSSREAVESDDDLSTFKMYLHVNRSIQDEFMDEVIKYADSPSNHIIMLCGNVGDGKSHLLAYLKTVMPEVYEKFTIHNDATESHNPNETAIDTLARVLKPFNDLNINNSDEKIILAINLGVLNNFLESDYCNNEFTILKKLIDDANLFDTKVLTKNQSNDKVSFITFSDYNLFELNDDKKSGYVSSNYLSSLFNKITIKTDLNPFYVSYRKDKENNFDDPIIYNYEFFSDEDNQKLIIEYLIRIFLKYKKIVSTRDLLNFIYEIIVPPHSLEDNKDFNDLLPNLLFNNPDRSSLLKLFNELDPTTQRNEEIDRFIIDFHYENKFYNILEKYFVMDDIEFLKPYFDDIDNIINEGNYKKLYAFELSSYLIRLSLFYGVSSLKDSFEDDVYLQFLKYLYYYNTSNYKGFKSLYNEVRNSIFKWSESSKKNYVCVEELNDFKIFKKVNLYPAKKIKQSHLGDFEDVELGNRFKNEITLYFKLDKTNNYKIPIDIDFQLYEYITKLNNGFKPNVKDIEKLTVFDQFVKLIIDKQESNNLLITHLETGKEFSFVYDEDFETFEFNGV